MLWVWKDVWLHGAQARVRALGAVGVDGTCVAVLEQELVHMNSQVSEEVPVLGGVGQGDPIFPELCTATAQELFEDAQLKEKGVNMDRERLSNLRFAKDVVQTAEDVKDMEHLLDTVKAECLKVGVRISWGKTIFVTDVDTTGNIQMGRVGRWLTVGVWDVQWRWEVEQGRKFW